MLNALCALVARLAHVSAAEESDLMINSVIKLLLFQAMGEILAISLSIPVPGPVVGMLFLFLHLAFRGREDDGLAAFSARFLSHLPLLFIPAAVGIMLHLDRVAAERVPISLRFQEAPWCRSW